MTHGSRDIDTSHTSWFEIFAFKRFVESKSTIVKCLSQSMIDEQVLSGYDKLIVFNSGKVSLSLVDAINQSDVEVYLIYQDPNWGLDFRIDRDYILITPFAVFKDKHAYEEVYPRLKEILPELNVSRFSQHIYLPFGNMGLFDDFYDKSSTGYSMLKTHDSVYIGSQKHDRMKDLKIASVGGIDVYGNFESIDKLSKEYDFDSNLVELKGRIPSTSVESMMSQYEYVLYLPDKKMLDLDVSYRRQVENLGHKIKIAQSTRQLNRHLKSISDKKDDYVIFKKSKLIKHYGEMSKSLVRDVLDLDEDSISVEDIEKLFRMTYFVDDFTRSNVVVRPTSLEIDIDQQVVIIQQQIEFSVLSGNVYVDLLADMTYRLPIEVAQHDKAISYEIGSVNYLREVDLNEKSIMKIRSVVNRMVSQVIKKQVERMRYKNEKKISN